MSLINRMFALLVAIVVVTGCSASTPAPTATAQTTSAPAWYTPAVKAKKLLPLPKGGYSTKRSVITGCQKTSNEVIISFDDGITNQKKLDKLLKVLKTENVRGYFFLTGQFAKNNPKMMKQIATAGHVLGNHSYDHANFSLLNKAAIKKQIQRGVQGNTAIKLLRPPYGNGAFNTATQKLAKSLGHGMCYWTVDSMDWSSKASPSAKAIVTRVMKGDKYTNGVKKGGVILLHGTSKYGVDATANIIKATKAKGLQFVKLYG